MNRAARGLGIGMARAIVLGGAIALSFTALAGPIDDGLPPSRYDIGGVTEADTLANIHAIFDTDAPPLIRVRESEVLAECDRIQMQRYSMHYLYDGILQGCLIRDYDLSRPVIVYSYDPTDPTVAARILRHEIGHHLGWPGDHPREVTQ